MIKFVFGEKNNRFSSIFVRYLTFLHLSPKEKHIFQVFWRKQGFHDTYLCEENKRIKLQSWREELFVTFVQGIIEFAINENRHKTPE